MPTLAKNKIEKRPFPIYPIESWSVHKYGVQLFINFPNCRLFEDGISLDVEDDEHGNFVGLGIYDPAENSCFYWSSFELIRQITIPKFIAHNGISDLRKLQKWGFKVDESLILHDTMLMMHIFDSSRYSYELKALVKEDLGIEYPSYDDIVGKRTKMQKNPRVTLDKQPLELVANYNAMDCLATYKLYERQAKILGNLGISDTASTALNYFNRIEKPSSFVFQKMSEKGIKVDLAYLSDLKDTLEGRLLAVKLPILNELGGINLDSPKQLLTALNAKGITPILKGKPSTDKRALEKYQGQYKVVDLLFNYSELSTLLSNFTYPYLERNEEIVHPQYRQCGTRTGRPSCSNPNLLQIPKRSENGKLVRRMFVAREGRMFGDLDFGQIEPRVLAHLSKDNVLCEMFNNGVDFHTFTSERLGISRERAKILNLSVGYRATYKSVSQQMKCSWNEAQKVIDQWWSLFPQLHDWESKLIYESRKSGICTSLMGRNIKIDNLNSKNEFQREGAERQLINNITQASAAEIMKLGMIEVDKNNIDILIQVYDELLIESSERGIQEEVIRASALLQYSVKLDVPLTVEAGIGNNWQECKK